MKKNLEPYIQMKLLGKTEETILSHFRGTGGTKIESILLLKEVFGVSLETAKSIVHESGAWADVKESDQKLHAELEKGINSLKD